MTSVEPTGGDIVLIFLLATHTAPAHLLYFLTVLLPRTNNVVFVLQTLTLPDIHDDGRDIIHDDSRRDNIPDEGHDNVHDYGRGTNFDICIVVMKFMM